MSEQDDKDPIEHWTAILIAIVTVIAAVVAWRASVAADGAGDEDYDGLRAVVNVQEVQTLSTVEANQHAQAYANYRKYDENAWAIGEDLEGATGARRKELEQQKAEAEALVDAKLTMFPQKYMDRTLKYHTDAEIGELVAAEAKARDLEPEPHFIAAEGLRAKAENLLMGVVIMSLGLVCLTLVESLEGSGRKGMLGVGVLLGIAGAIYSVMVEMGKL